MEPKIGKHAIARRRTVPFLLVFRLRSADFDFFFPNRGFQSMQSFSEIESMLMPKACAIGAFDGINPGISQNKLVQWCKGFSTDFSFPLVFRLPNAFLRSAIVVRVAVLSVFRLQSVIF